MDEAVQRRLAELVRGSGYRQYLGPASRELSEELALMTASSEAILLSSGSAAAEIALRAAGVTAGDRVLLSGYDYPGNFWAIERVGARPLLVDVIDGGWQICPQAVTAAFEADGGPRPKALIASHLHGQIQPIDSLRAVCDAHETLLIEDACQAFGARLPSAAKQSKAADAAAANRPAGCVGHVGLVSFGGGKVVSAGRGGGVVTQDAHLAQRMRLAAGAGSGPYAMSEVTAAVVLAQLPFLQSINALSAAYFAELAGGLLPEWGVPWRETPHGTAFYNAGLIVEDSKTSLESLKSQLGSSKVTLGDSFVGFHRRSARRCDKAAQLQYAIKAAERTVVLHHHLAIDETIDASQLATILNQALADARVL